MKKISFIIMALLSGSVFAQQASVFNESEFTGSIRQSELEMTDIAPPGDGNVFERDVTPKLREISRKKSLLELKRVDLEIEKLDMELYKIQQERLSNIGSSITNRGSSARYEIIDPTNINNPVVGSVNTISDMSLQNKVDEIEPEVVVETKTETPVAEVVDQYIPISNHGIYVLMTYGFKDDLYAKITSGSQGGYVVRKGDVLPNGKTVTRVNSNYIEVLDRSDKRAKKERIFVTGMPDSSAPIGAVAAVPTPEIPVPTGNQGSDAISVERDTGFGGLTVPGVVSSTSVTQLPPIPTYPQMSVTPLTGAR